MMEFKFDAEQEYQINAVDAITGLLEGQPRNELDLTFALTGFAAVPNKLDLSEEVLLWNLQAVQEQNGITPDTALQTIEEHIITAEGEIQVRFPNFSVEMETGTGKTYVYIRTILELFRRYGLRKFIVVVPSVAVREGVLKSLQITQKHFHNLYNNVPYRYYSYDSNNLAQVRQFALSDSIELMVMTIDSFNKASNVIHQSTDRLQGETPIHLVQTARPILILDEPQNMESELRIKALSQLHPLFALRYSATHRNPYNLVYRLTPYEAYRQGLVKRIEVASVVQETDANQVFLRLIGITTAKKTITAQLAVHKLMKSGTVREHVMTVKVGDSLQEKTGRLDYGGYEVSEINPGLDMLMFSNGVEIEVGETQGADKAAIFKEQIRYTVEEHFHRQIKLRPQGIKVLSLFFIDRVDNYRLPDSMIRRLFTQAFNELKTKYAQKYPEWKEIDPEAVQGAYFASKRTKEGDILLEDSTSGESQKDKEAYDLIMKDKERLLSLNEPVSFIFSHSALREGWDNPNVFQICTLNQTASEVKKRQEVGRGVRLAVDQTGERIRDEKINVLTVVANESYENYIARLQSELTEAYGTDGLPPKPANARKRGVATLRKEFTLKPEFKELWERIKYQTRYAVKIDTAKLIDDVIQELDRVTIAPPQIAITKVQVTVGSNDTLDTIQMGASRTPTVLTGRTLPNIIDIMDNLMEYTTPPVSLTRSTLLAIFERTSNKQAAMANPYAFATEAVRIIKEKLADQLVSGIQYKKLDLWYEMTRLDTEIESWEDYLIPATHSVYDYVIYDSEVEKTFVEGLERRDDVKLYLKLPPWFTVPTPVGNYNPDWAIVLEERDAHGQSTDKPLLYLVRETKGSTRPEDLRPDERRKTLCGKFHFGYTLGVDYKVVTTSDELM
jgi:type III restriction enzyme